MSAQWYFDEQLWQDFYHCMFSPAHFQQGEEQVAALLKLLGNTPEQVLDLGCGPGRHALPLARGGCRVTAVDASPLLLERLRAECGNLPVEVCHADMREFCRPRSFELVVCLWTSFGYFDDHEDNLQVLNRCHANLNAGGRLVIDTVGKEYLTRHLQPVHAVEYDDGSLLIQRPVLIDEMTRVETEWILVSPADRVRRCRFRHHVYSGSEMRAMLAAAGFRQIELFGDWKGGPYELDAERLIAIARKY